MTDVGTSASTGYKKKEGIFGDEVIEVATAGGAGQVGELANQERDPGLEEDEEEEEEGEEGEAIGQDLGQDDDMVAQFEEDMYGKFFLAHIVVSLPFLTHYNNSMQNRSQIVGQTRSHGLAGSVPCRDTAKV